MGNVSKRWSQAAKKAEEYGSHDKTFWLEEAGTVRVKDSSGNILFRARC